MPKKKHQDGLKAELVCKKLTPIEYESLEKGIKETRTLWLRGNFKLFVPGLPKPLDLPVKLTFKDKPETVQMIQNALNIEKIDEKCLLEIHSNEHGRLDDWIAELKQRTAQQELEFPPEPEPYEEEE